MSLPFFTYALLPNSVNASTVKVTRLSFQKGICQYVYTWKKIQCRQQQLINGNCRLDNFCVCFGIFAAAIMVPCRRRPVARIPILMSVYTIHMYLSGSGERERADGQLDGRREERYSVTINPSCNTLPLGFIFSGRDLLR